MTVVVGYAPTPEGQAALATAGEEAARRAARVVVVSTSRGESHVDPTYRATSALPHLVAQMRSRGLEVEVRDAYSGDPAEAIVSTAEDVGAALVVIGLRRRSAVGKLLLGSTAQRVLLHSPCNVLAVRGPGLR